jgi:hypothetical protein
MQYSQTRTQEFRAARCYLFSGLNAARAACGSKVFKVVVAGSADFPHQTSMLYRGLTKYSLRGCSRGHSYTPKYGITLERPNLANRTAEVLYTGVAGGNIR